MALAQQPHTFVYFGERALRAIGAVGLGVPVRPDQQEYAFQAFNDMIDTWAVDRLTVFQSLVKEFPLVAFKGGVSNPYTVGVGGDFDMPRPTWITDALLLVKTTVPAYEYQLHILKAGQWNTIGIKDLPSGLANCLYFDGKWDTTGPQQGLGNLYLNPVPDGTLPVSLRLYVPVPMSGFADLDATAYIFPPGYREALVYQGMRRLALDLGKALTPDQQQLAAETFRMIKDANAQTPNITSDVGIPGTRGGSLYNWRTGTNAPAGRNW
jgi:hypothetical protein